MSPDPISITDVNFALSPEVEVRPSLFSEIPWKLHIFFILDRMPVPGSMFRRRLSFFVGKSIREYFMGKSGALHYFFRILVNLEL